MKNRSLTTLTGGIIYRKEVRQEIGSVTASVLMQQLDYWFGKYPDGFYKFQSPTPNHPDYKEGDSWEEELAFSQAELRSAFDVIGVRHLSKSAYTKVENPFMGDDGQECFYCCYHDRKTGLTWYFRNHQMVDSLIDRIARINQVVPVKGKSKRCQSSVNQQSSVTVTQESSVTVNQQSSVTVTQESSVTVNQQSSVTVTQESSVTVNQQSSVTVTQESSVIEIKNPDLHNSGKFSSITEDPSVTLYIDSEITTENTAEITTESVNGDFDFQNFATNTQTQAHNTELELESKSVEVVVEPFTKFCKKPEEIFSHHSFNPEAQSSFSAEDQVTDQGKFSAETGLDPQIQEWLDKYDRKEIKDLPQQQKFKAANCIIGDKVRKYRKSGIILASRPNDINREFLEFVAWRELKNPKNYTYATNYVLMCEKDISKWAVLSQMVEAWLEFRENPQQKIAEEAKMNTLFGKPTQTDKTVAITDYFQQAKTWDLV
jgi:hypothetical protein